jgi:broad specificity phosphatase PhoE
MSTAASNMIMTRWWWVRHAPVTEDGGCIYGQADLDCDCTSEDVFTGLERFLPREAVWVTSNLRRTHQTAQAILARRKAETPAAPLVVPELAEQHLGEWQGRDRAAFFGGRTARPDSYWFGPADERPPGGESFEDLVARAGPAIARINRMHAGRDLVAVAHGGTIRAALSLALGTPPQTALAFAIANCSVTRIDHVRTAGAEGWRVALVNHIPAP